MSRAPTSTMEGPDSSVARRRRALVVGTEALIALALGSFRLGTKSLWFDEGFSAMASSRGPRGALHVAHTSDSNMAGYHVLLSLWHAFGSSEAALRSLAVIAVAITVIPVYAIADRLYDARTGLIAGLLAATAPFAVRYAQEVRSYALLMLLVTVASWCFVRAVQTRHAPWFALYATVAAAACYAHLYALLVIAAQLASLVALRWSDIPLRKLARALVVFGVLLLPLAYFVASATQEAGSGSRPTVSSTISVATNVAGGKLLAVVLGGLAFVTIVAATLVWKRLGRSDETWRAVFTPTWIVVPSLLAFVIAFVRNTNWEPRYLIIVLPALVIAAAAPLGKVADTRIVAGALVVIAVLSAFKVANWYRAPSHEDWRGAVSLVASRTEAGDGIIFCIPSVRAPFEYYLLRQPTSRRPQPLSPSAPWGDGLHLDAAPGATAEAYSTNPRIWVVSRYANGSSSGACDLRVTMAGRARSYSTDVGGITVERYDRQ